MIKNKILTKTINNNGMSEKGTYGYLNRSNSVQRYRRGYKNTSCWGYVLNHAIGIHDIAHVSKYNCVRRIQRREN